MEKKGRPSRLTKKVSDDNIDSGVQVRNANWLKDDYRRILNEIQDFQLWSDIFVCAYDGIPVQMLADAIHTQNPHRTLTELRKKYQSLNSDPVSSSLEHIKSDSEERMYAAEQRKTSAVKAKDELQSLLDFIMEPGKFDHDQIHYLLTCIEDDVDIEIVREIACPGYPVDVIKKLKEIKERRRSHRQSQAGTPEEMKGGRIDGGSGF